MDDEVRLMQQAQRNPALFAPLYERYVDRVYAYCRRRAASPQDAEDLCSMVFARALAGLHTYQGGHVAAWLFRIAHNVVVNHYRGRVPLVPLDDDFSADDLHFDAVERAEELDAFSANSSPNCRKTSGICCRWRWTVG
ncbi:MAG: sigma factor [Anaerolineae bacterium]